MTVVVNVKHEKADIYCGRPSYFGNPFRIGKDGTRLEVIRKFIDYFIHKICHDRTFREKLQSLKNKRIGCYCHPLPCHLDVIAEYLDNYEYRESSEKNCFKRVS